MASPSGALVAASLQSRLVRRLGLKAGRLSRAEAGPPTLPSQSQSQSWEPSPAGEDALSALDWRVIEGSLAGRGDAHCPICMEPFVGHEVLLSCSHMFHRPCLLAFERVVRASQRRCPVCRSASYQKKITHEGTRSYTALCAVRLQALFRGWRARRVADRMRRSVYLSGGGSRLFRRRFVAAELAALSSAIDGAAERETAAALSDGDSALRLSREVEEEFRRMLEHRSEQTRRIPPSGPGKQEGPSSPTGEADVLSEEKWGVVLDQYLARRAAECAICMGPLSEDTAASLRRGLRERSRRAVLLSCSHAFHDRCIGRLEELLLGSALAQEDLGLRSRCPVCRQGPYSKRLLALDGQHFI